MFIVLHGHALGQNLCPGGPEIYNFFYPSLIIITIYSVYFSDLCLEGSKEEKFKRNTSI